MAVRKPGKSGGSKATVSRTGKSGRFVEVVPGKGRSSKALAASVLSQAPTMRIPRGGLEKAGLVKVSNYERIGRSGKQQVTANTTLKKTGGSLVMTLPAAIRKALSLAAGTEMAVTVEGSKVVMEPVTATVAQAVRRPKYTLDELLTGSDPDVAMTDEERSWHDAAPVGREIW